VNDIIRESAHVATASWHFANIIDSLARPCVPLFVMISGALLLSPSKPYHLQKRLNSIVIPLITISLVYGLWYAYHDPTYPFWQNIQMAWYKPLSYHLWFSYMMIGLYLLAPILRHIAENKILTRYFLIIWFFFSIIIEGLRPLFGYWLGDWSLNLHGGYLGYFLLGYVLANWKIPIKYYNFTILWIGGFVITAIGMWASMVFAGSYSEVTYAFVAPSVFMMCVGAFITIKHLCKDKISPPLIANLGKLSYGVYLYHIIFVAWFDGWIVYPYLQTWNPGSIILTRILTVSILSYLLCFALAKIKYLRTLALGS